MIMVCKAAHTQISNTQHRNIDSILQMKDSDLEHHTKGKPLLTLFPPPPGGGPFIGIPNSLNHT